MISGKSCQVTMMARGMHPAVAETRLIKGSGTCEGMGVYD